MLAWISETLHWIVLSVGETALLRRFCRAENAGAQAMSVRWVCAYVPGPSNRGGASARSDAFLQVLNS